MPSTTTTTTTVTTTTADDDSLLKRLQAMEDKEAITNLFHKYMHVVDTNMNTNTSFTAEEMKKWVTDDFVEDAGPFGKNEPGPQGMATFLNTVSQGFR
jgi:hypothetical protein